MHLFEAVKQSVTTRQAAERYGLNVNRNGMAVCPFHRDRHPSMKVDCRYYCFGCGATGDVIDFVSRLHGMSAKEAALMLARDFSIPYEDGTDAPRQSAMKKLRQEAEGQKYRRMEQHCFQVLADYYHLLRRWREEHAPSQPDEAWHPLFVEALQRLDYIEYLLDGLLSDDLRERAAIVTEYGKEVRAIEQRISGLAAAGPGGHSGLPLVALFTLPPHSAPAARGQGVRGEGTVLGRVPLGGQVGVEGGQAVFPRQDLPVGAHRTAAARDPGFDLRPPHMALFTLPPHCLVTAGQYILGPQAAVEGGVPLGGQVGEAGGQVAASRQRDLAGAHRAARAIPRAGCHPRLPLMAFFTEPPCFIAGMVCHLIRGQCLIFLRMPLHRNMRTQCS